MTNIETHSASAAQASAPPLEVLAPENLRWPYPLFQWLLAEAPVHFDKQSQAWVVSRYHDITGLLKHPNISADRYAALTDHASGEEREQNSYVRSHLSLFLLNAEDPVHRRLRGLTNRAFTPNQIVAMRPLVEAMVRDHLDAIIASGRMEVVRDLAYPLPMKFICRLLGVPSTDGVAIRKWSDDLSVYIGSAGKAANCIGPAYQAIHALSKFFVPFVLERRQNPQQDLISAMVNANVEGDRLTDEEVIANCILFLVAGFETVTSLVAAGVLALLQHPEQRAIFTKDSGTDEACVEETLRFYPPVNRTARLCVEEVAVSGFTVPKNAIVILMLGAGRIAPSNRVSPRIPPVT